MFFNKNRNRFVFFFGNVYHLSFLFSTIHHNINIVFTGKRPNIGLKSICFTLFIQTKLHNFNFMRISAIANLLVIFNGVATMWLGGQISLAKPFLQFFRKVVFWFISGQSSCAAGCLISVFGYDLSYVSSFTHGRGS
jgi:hypothetical protein